MMPSLRASLPQLPTGQPPPHVKHSIDLPGENDICEPLSIRARGWIASPPDATYPFSGVRVLCDGRPVAECRPLLFRADVAQVHALPPTMRTGFDLLFSLDDRTSRAHARLDFQALAGDAPPVPFGTRMIRLATRDYRRGLFPEFLDPQTIELRHRSHLFRTGPPAAEPSPECVALICERLQPGTHRRLLDVGCGIGAYARPLRDAGFDWMGCEVDAARCTALAQAGLPHARVERDTLPFADGSFDAALCIEVLEHVVDIDTFLREVRRVAREVIISVPNGELIPFLAPQLVTPWHMLEPDHKNFFSRWTLRDALARHFAAVDVVAYGPAPVRTLEGAELYYHLLAHARG